MLPNFVFNVLTPTQLNKIFFYKSKFRYSFGEEWVLSTCELANVIFSKVFFKPIDKL